MTPERFRAIVDAYGADARNWPADERAAASAWAEQHRGEADALLAEAAQLDMWLASDTVAAPDPAFVERVVASAPVRRRRPRWLPLTWPGSRSRRAGLWWSGAAFAGVGLIGGLAGAFAVSFFLVTGNPSPGPESSYLTTGFGGTAADWSGE
ncbi:hypothetical protein ACFQ3P_07965 [Paraburkholderia sabiae]|jgi:hypothetical protein|uniref:Anti-sigma factor n=1 Tax=Paraburkholderia sabiae TaxID=273251 RepID=A0ABU9Q484_9BURK|nr:hypothetical protein [Paraburkholderia sabiae]WJZ71721.1 hypothetical protein QEN71_16175 [Paraburkholderia sabiae]CAD6519173.1 hypothetical protein LMG24235_01218 [Paraburkholderia sabiae]